MKPDIEAIKMPDETWAIYNMSYKDGPLHIGWVWDWDGEGRLVFKVRAGVTLYADTLIAVGEVVAGLGVER